MIKKLEVKGMTCSHCEAAVKGALGELSDVKNVDVNLDTKIVIVEGENLEDSKLIEAIDEVGFDVSKVE